MKNAPVENNRTLELLINSIVDYAIFMLDTKGYVKTWNTGAERLKGYSPEEIIGKPFSIFYTPEDRESGLPQKALATARETGRFASEGCRVRKDGTRFWALVVLDAIRDEEGRLIGFAKVTRDITERQRAHDDLLESERRYRRLVEAVVDYAIFQLDTSGHVATWNSGAQRIKGYAPEEIIGRHFSAFYTPEDLQNEVPKMALAQAAQQGRFEAEGWRMRKDGTRFWASVVIDRITDERGEVLGFAKVTRDLTERKQAQDELKHVQEQLLASQKLEAIGQLSGGIAHDFNNLLMIVLGNIETAERNSRHVGSANLHRALANAKRGAQRAAALTSRLLAFSRRQALDPKPINLNNFLNGLQDFLQRTLGERVELQTVGGAGLWQIEVDVNHLESAIVNLAINARDAMPNGGKLTVEAANVSADEDYARANPEVAVGQYVVICVSDTGSGMSQEVLEHAFEPFFTTKEPGQGTGLGLSQVYGFVKQSGGNVKIYSEVGEGTSIRMYFPRYHGVVHPAPDDGSDLVAEGEATETILVVEDDADLRTYVSDVLRDLNYRVLSAGSAQAALTILLQEEHQVDLLLTDVVMPGINGRELGRRAQQIRPHLHILYMTGYSRNAVVHQGRLDEGVDLLEKPITQAKLALKVREMLDRCSSKSLR
ncbi:PAS domain S-box protein [Bradyrhizobium sp. 182]|uniref:hybrid sensor histidine kinase/response regulator n=1 Tax=unclassified Bradyrhizobium TaxID=2631580 RepID=UPI001FF80108|nr:MULTISPECIES: PAS domain-containing sensor histidine kinase [unclassified Bradyrhizobium]MCK1421346.1 PAS domain S-box protein [Bradyrhizobium sp. CW12]MCK1528224.1 PAS domain S-box protein [Bradyrhizobium sp. 182]MCK1643450.1 PAS domain S-box protein [Bradyrhizobium sp. 154]